MYNSIHKASYWGITVSYDDQFKILNIEGTVDTVYHPDTNCPLSAEEVADIIIEDLQESYMHEIHMQEVRMQQSFMQDDLHREFELPF